MNALATDLQAVGITAIIIKIRNLVTMCRLEIYRGLAGTEVSRTKVVLANIVK